MALSFLFGKTEAELLELLSTFQDEWLKVSRNISVSAGDASASMLLSNIEDRIYKVMQALYQLDSTTYAQFSNCNQSTIKLAFS